MNKNIIRVPNPFIPILLSTKVNQICPQTNVLYVNMYDNIVELQEILRKNNVHSVPVLENGSCIGVVDGLDISKFYFLDPPTFPQRSQDTTVFALLATNTVQSLPVFANTTLLDVISIVAPGVHRAIVLESESNHTLFSVCSESDIVAALYCYLQADKYTPAHTICQLPISGFSNYLAKIKYSIDCTASLEQGVKYVSQALTSTTTQHGVTDTEGDSTTTATTKPTTTQTTAAATTPGNNNNANNTTNNQDTTNNDENATNADLEWNAPLVVVISGDQIIGHLNTTVLHTNIAQTENADNMSQNLGKSIVDYLRTFDQPQQQQNQPTPVSTPPTTESDDASSITTDFSLGFVVRHTISLFSLLQLMTNNKLDYVWVVTDNTLFDAYLTSQKDAAVATATPSDDNMMTDGGDLSKVDYFELQRGNYIPKKWFDQQQLGIMTLNDVLRLISRDNVWLNQDCIVAHASQ